MRKLVRLIALTTSVLALNVNAMLISLEVDYQQRWEAIEEAEYSASGDIIRSDVVFNQVQNIDLTHHSIGYSVDLQEAYAAGRYFRVRETSEFLHRNLQLSVGGNAHGAFYSDLMNLIDLTQYSDFSSYLVMSSSSYFGKASEQGRDSIQFHYTLAGSKTTSDGSIEISDDFLYRTSFYTSLPSVTRSEDLTLTNLDAIEQMLLNNQGLEFGFYETLRVGSNRLDLSTGTSVSNQRSIEYSGVARYAVSATSVSEPETLGLMLLGACGLLMVRRRSG